MSYILPPFIILLCLAWSTLIIAGHMRNNRPKGG